MYLHLCQWIFIWWCYRRSIHRQWKGLCWLKTSWTGWFLIFQKLDSFLVSICNSIFITLCLENIPVGNQHLLSWDLPWPWLYQVVHSDLIFLNSYRLPCFCKMKFLQQLMRAFALKSSWTVTLSLPPYNQWCEDSPQFHSPCHLLSTCNNPQF